MAEYHILKMLRKNAQDSKISFHTPGHKGRRAFARFFKEAENDITELDFSDDLANPHGVIDQAQRDMAKILTGESGGESFIVTDGTTCGVYAMLYTMAYVLPVKKIRPYVIIPRNSHKSVYNACRVLGIELIILENDILDGVMQPITPAQIAKACEAFDQDEENLKQCAQELQNAKAELEQIVTAKHNAAAAYNYCANRMQQVKSNSTGQDLDYGWGNLSRECETSKKEYFALTEREKVARSKCVGLQELHDRLQQESMRKVCGILITSPDYYGTIADVKGIRQVAEAKDIPLAVDGAHGTHLAFIPQYKEYYAGTCANLWTDGLHKCMPAYTQASLVSAASAEMGKNILKSLNLFRTSSPSYPIMASAEFGVKYVAEHRADLDKLYNEKGTGAVQVAIQKLTDAGYHLYGYGKPLTLWKKYGRIYSQERIGSGATYLPQKKQRKKYMQAEKSRKKEALAPQDGTESASYAPQAESATGVAYAPQDPFKLCVDMAAAKINVPLAQKALQARRMTAEFFDGRYLMFYVSPMSTPLEVEKLTEALLYIKKNKKFASAWDGGIPNPTVVQTDIDAEMASLGLDYNTALKKLGVSQSGMQVYGKIAATNIGIIPPGYPMVLAGEPIGLAAHNYIQNGAVFGCNEDGSVDIILHDQNGE